MIIGIAGKLGSGKDFVSNNMIVPILKNKNCTFLQICFADQIKVNVMTKNNIDFKDVYIDKTKETRSLLQTEGTELGRDTLGKDIWIRYFDNWISIYSSRGIEHFICTDVRFTNELEYIRERGGIVIKIDAPKRNYQRLLLESSGDLNLLEKLSSHQSECNLDHLSNEHFDLVINNDIGNEDNFQQIYSEFNNLLDAKMRSNI